MKLIILNISPTDSIKVNNYLRKLPVYFIKVANIGGVLTSGTYTYLIKVPKEIKDEVVKNLISICKSRKVKMSMVGNVEMGMFHNVQTTQTVGGGSLFVIDLDQFIKL